MGTRGEFSGMDVYNPRRSIICVRSVNTTCVRTTEQARGVSSRMVHLAGRVWASKPQALSEPVESQLKWAKICKALFPTCVDANRETYVTAVRRYATDLHEYCKGYHMGDDDLGADFYLRASLEFQEANQLVAQVFLAHSSAVFNRLETAETPFPPAGLDALAAATEQQVQEFVALMNRRSADEPSGRRRLEEERLKEGFYDDIRGEPLNGHEVKNMMSDEDVMWFLDDFDVPSAAKRSRPGTPALEERSAKRRSHTKCPSAAACLFKLAWDSKFNTAPNTSVVQVLRAIQLDDTLKAMADSMQDDIHSMTFGLGNKGCAVLELPASNHQGVVELKLKYKSLKN